MFHMGDDVKILAVAAASASAAVAAALVLASSIARRIDRLRSASAALAAGDLGARAPEGGPRELAELGRSFNAMAGSLEGLFDARRELVAAASHDLRAPVASIAAMLEAIEDGLATPGGVPRAPPGSGEAPDDSRRRPLRARPHRRRRARPRAARSRARPARRIVRARLRGRGSRPERHAGENSRRRRPRGALRARGGRARPAQPPHERPPPHAVGRDGRRHARHGAPTTSASRSRTPATASRRKRRAGCSTASGETTPPGRQTAAPASAWRSPAGSSKPRAARSGPSSAPPAAPSVSFTLPLAGS